MADKGRCPFAVWRPTKNYGYHGETPDNRPLLFVDHIMGGWKRTMDDTNWLNNSGISSHFGIGKDGSLSQYVNIFHSSYANGVVGQSPRGSRRGIELYNRANPRLAAIEREAGTNWRSVETSLGPKWTLSLPTGGNAWNQRTITTEHEGLNQNDPWTDAMVDTTCRVKKWCNEELLANGFSPIPFSYEGIIGHCDIDHIDRIYCPGPGRPLEKILALLNPQMEDDEMAFQVLAYGKLEGEVAADDYLYDLTRLGFPADAKRVRVQVWPQAGSVIEFYHGIDDDKNRDAGRVYEPYGWLEIIPNWEGKCFVVPPGARFDISPLGYWT